MPETLRTAAQNKHWVVKRQFMISLSGYFGGTLNIVNITL
jgi:hypothetical protein